MHAIDELAEFAAGFAGGTLQGEKREACARLVFDLMAATAGGMGSDLAAAARDAARALYGSGKASVWFTGHALSVAGAAMANAAAASALDIDDGHRGAAGHPGAGVIPAVFAVAQNLNSSDDDIFDAMAIGYEIGIRVAAARPVSTIDTYVTGRWVNYGVAAAVGRLLGLRSSEMAHALAIAGAEGPMGFPSGSSKYQGSTVKEQIPAAVVVGLTAAYRAKAGATGPRDLLDAEDKYTRALLTGNLGEDWQLQHCYLKPYACCRYIHAPIDAVLALRRPDAPINRLRIETFPRGLKLANERVPKTLEGAQYSYYFSCALAAVHGASALQPMSFSALSDPDVLALSSRIELVSDEAFAPMFPRSTPCRVILDQGEGPEILVVEQPLGDVGNPMSIAQIEAKFLSLSLGVLAPDRQKRMVRVLRNLAADGFRPLFDAW